MVPIPKGIPHLVSSQDGFGHLFEKALRAEEDVDWSQHTVDYVLFKARLKFFARRRARLRNMIRDSPDGRIPETILEGILAEPFPLLDDEELLNDSKKMQRRKRHQEQQKQQQMQTGRGGGDGDDLNAPGGNVDGSLTTNYLPFELQRSGSLSDGDESEASGRDPQLAPAGGRRKSKRSVMRRVSKNERKEMFRFLTWEMDTAQMLYLSSWQKLSAQLDAIVAGTASSSASWSPRSRKRRQQQLLGLEPPSTEQHGSGAMIIELGEEILELFAFCTINIVTARQILIRYDAFARTFEGTPISQYYMKMVKKTQQDVFRFSFVECDKLCRCTKNLSSCLLLSHQVLKHATSFRKLLFHEELHAVADAYSASMPDNLPFLVHFAAQRGMFRDILKASESAASIASTGHERVMHDSFIHHVRNWVLLGLFEDGLLNLDPSYLTMRGKSLTSGKYIICTSEGRFWCVSIEFVFVTYTTCFFPKHKRDGTTRGVEEEKARDRASANLGQKTVGNAGILNHAQFIEWFSLLHELLHRGGTICTLQL